MDQWLEQENTDIAETWPIWEDYNKSILVNKSVVVIRKHGCCGEVVVNSVVFLKLFPQGTGRGWILELLHSSEQHRSLAVYQGWLCHWQSLWYVLTPATTPFISSEVGMYCRIVYGCWAVNNRLVFFYWYEIGKDALKMVWKITLFGLKGFGWHSPGTKRSDDLL